MEYLRLNLTGNCSGICSNIESDGLIATIISHIYEAFILLGILYLTNKYLCADNTTGYRANKNPCARGAYSSEQKREQVDKVGAFWSSHWRNTEKRAARG